MTLFVLGIILGLQAGLYGRRMLEWLEDVAKTPTPSGVTRGTYTEPHTQGHSGAVISPKTPQEIEFDVAQDLKRMNGR